MLLFVAIAGLLALAGAVIMISALRRRIHYADAERARLDRAMSDFLAIASHELRTPLASIKGFVELLHRSSENMSERQREFLAIILKSTERLNEMVGELLDVARIDADPVELDCQPVAVGDAVREVAEMMAPRIAAKRQHLSIDVAPTLPLALADPARVHQIVANLLTNAHLYTGENGHIHVSAGSDGACVALSVSDTGVGMTPEQAGRIFDRFYRADEAVVLAPGTGLGLSIVKSLVGLDNGRIEVETTPGRGSTFRVLIPAARLAPDLTSALDAILGPPQPQPARGPSLEDIGIEHRRPITGAPRAGIEPQREQAEMA